MEKKVMSPKEKVQDKLHPKVAQTIQGHAAPTHSHEPEGEKTVAATIPHSLKVEHEELHGDLSKAVAAGGKVGEAASEVAMILHPHFEKEEEYALPPLGLLPALAQGKVTPEMASILTMTDKLKADLPHMLEEHKAVVAALEKLIAASKEEHKLEHARFAERLMMHARTEEEVSYPTAILVGKYVRLKLQA